MDIKIKARKNLPCKLSLSVIFKGTPSLYSLLITLLFKARSREGDCAILQIPNADSLQVYFLSSIDQRKCGWEAIYTNVKSRNLFIGLDQLKKAKETRVL